MARVIDSGRIGSMLPIFTPGSDIVVEERWRGRLWGAAPHRVIASGPESLITSLPRTTRRVFATNRGLPVAEGLTRDQRKHLALKTGIARPVAFDDPLDQVSYFAPGRWAKIILAWNPDQDGAFLGWYVNFELPPCGTDTGLWGKDLVLDLYVNADGSWAWKDAEEFDRALDDGLFAPSLRTILEAEAERVLDDHAHRRGAFDPALLDLRPDPADAPVLPDDYAPGGDRWRRTYPVQAIPHEP